MEYLIFRQEIQDAHGRQMHEDKPEFSRLTVANGRLIRTIPKNSFHRQEGRRRAMNRTA